MKLNFLLPVSLFLLASCQQPSATEELADLVNPFIGASTNVDAAGAYHGLGKTFPGATTPFGMVQVSPQTITGGDNGSGYSYEHQTIEGFSMTQMSGIGWNGDMGNFTVMPTTGELRTVAGRDDGTLAGWRSHYDKQSETASAGYYSVLLTDYSIRTEATATTRTGWLRFTFPADTLSRLQIDLARRVGGTASREYMKVVDDQTLEGWIECLPEGGGWGDGEGHARYTVYFHARLSVPMLRYGFWSAAISADEPRHLDDVVSTAYQQRVAEAAIVGPFPVASMDEARENITELEGTHIGFFTEFSTEEGQQLTLSVAISYVDMEGARRNYEAEAAGKTFDDVHREARQAWNTSLGCIEIEGGTAEERTVFYTALYHTLIDPRIHQDVDGRYVGGDYEVHEADSTFTKRTVFSGWDVFRSQMPLQTIINPTVVTDLLGSLTTMAQQSGRAYYERWELLNAYSGCMLGNPALSVLADAYAKGLRSGYDAELAYQYAKNSSARFGNDELGFTPGGLSISYTLEYAYTDWCIAQMARLLGKDDEAAVYEQKAKAYRNIFDAEHGWFRPREADGSWAPWPAEGRLKEWYGCIECNPLQQGWFVPHDVDGMVELMGGRDKVVADLDSMFAQTPSDMYWNLYYNHANEPVHFIPFLYNRLDEPRKTQQWTRFICAHAYHNKVEGLVGNEDVGQMSAWYVLAASGLHQYCPGDTRFELTSPVFRRIVFHLPNGNDFTVVAHNNSPEHIYIGSARLNDKPLDKLCIDYSEVMKGGVLELRIED
ncbi:MAG: GH92 family glycosyl hydrolase [Prevotella sp.]|nr:GH92 family glycosyl hydrolase [Prevotella sp.]